MTFFMDSTASNRNFQQAQTYSTPTNTPADVINNCSLVGGAVGTAQNYEVGLDRLQF